MSARPRRSQPLKFLSGLLIKLMLVLWAIGVATSDRLHAGEPTDSAASVAAPPPDSSHAPYDFDLRDQDGNRLSVRVGDADVTVVCFLGTECPLARLYAGRLEKLHQDFAGRGVQVVGAFSNRQDSAADMAKYATEYGVTFPLGKDEANRVADLYAAQRTPEVVVVDKESRICYRGRIDDQYLPGVARPQPETHDLLNAVEDLVAGREVAVPATEPQGCLIGREKQPNSDSDVTYCGQIAAVLNRNCVECHRTGEIGPFALTDYDEVVGWSDMMLEVVEQRRMPPWHADDQHARFKNARQMTDEDRQLLQQWVAAGCPYGNPADRPETPAVVTGWHLPRDPDLIVAMRPQPFPVPAEGTVDYQYFVVDPQLDKDCWVTAAQVVPGNRSVVHHAIVFIRPPDGVRFRGLGWLAAYVPGQRAYMLPPGHARFIPAGSKFVFQMHYTPTGQATDDVTRIGLLFGDESEVTHETFTLIGIDQEFEIPPQVADFPVTGKVRRLPQQGELLAIVPHMHLRGKSVEVSRVLKDRGESEVVLNVPRYDFNWQHIYALEQPIDLSEVVDLTFTAHFDNSSANPFNPDPSQAVLWGDQTWEEMAVVFFEVAEPRGHGREAEATTTPPAATQLNAEQSARAAQIIKNFDANGDGIVERLETPLSFRRFGFWRYDTDGDERLTEAEVRAAVAKGGK
ncbi:MAG: redoxin domain-containing protein [Planctomycetales bacterium]|nr:redoxin domain-containing protein [Planctomycetales bacterium]